MTQPGEQCEHGQLRRQCLICEQQEKIASLESRLAEALEDNKRLKTEILLRCIYCGNEKVYQGVPND